MRDDPLFVACLERTAARISESSSSYTQPQTHLKHDIVPVLCHLPGCKQGPNHVVHCCEILLLFVTELGNIHFSTVEDKNAATNSNNDRAIINQQTFSKQPYSYAKLLFPSSLGFALLELQVEKLRKAVKQLQLNRTAKASQAETVCFKYCVVSTSSDSPQQLTILALKAKWCCGFGGSKSLRIPNNVCMTLKRQKH